MHLQGAPFVQAQGAPEIPIEINEDDKKADSSWYNTKFPKKYLYLQILCT